MEQFVIDTIIEHGQRCLDLAAHAAGCLEGRMLGADVGQNIDLLERAARNLREVAWCVDMLALLHEREPKGGS